MRAVLLWIGLDWGNCMIESGEALDRGMTDDVDGINTTATA